MSSGLETPLSRSELYPSTSISFLTGSVSSLLFAPGLRSWVADRGRAGAQALSLARPTNRSAARMKKPPRTPPLLGERQGGRRPRRKSRAILEDLFSKTSEPRLDQRRFC